MRTKYADLNGLLEIKVQSNRLKKSDFSTKQKIGKMGEKYRLCRKYDHLLHNNDEESNESVLRKHAQNH